MCDFSGELALAMDRDRLRLVARVIDDLDLTRLDDEEFEVTVADRKERLPVPVHLGRGGGALGELANLGFVKRRKRDGLKVVFGHNYSFPQI